MSAPTPTGWVDDRLMQAYDLIYAVFLDADPASPEYAILRQASGLVEDADYAMEDRP